MGKITTKVDARPQNTTWTPQNPATQETLADILSALQGTLTVTGGGGGVEYTEDAPAAADPVGGAVILIRKDTPATQVSLDGDNVAQRGTNYGAAYVQLVTSAGAFIDSVGGGTQYADGAVRGTATGTIAMGDDGTNIQSLHCDSSGDLQIDVLTMPTVAVTGTFYQATQPISAASLPLPTGASTAAKQPALGTAGTASTDVITVQGIASMTALKVDGSAVTQPVSGTFYQATQPVSIASMPSTPVTGTFYQATQPVSLASVPSHAVTNAGTFAVQAAEADGANVTLGAKADAKSTATDTTAITIMQVLKQISASVQAPPSQAVTNAGTFAVQATLQAGTAEIGKLAAGVAEIGNVKNSGTFATQATLQTGSAAIGKLAANSGVDIGDVDITSIIPGTGATNLGKAEDAAHASGDTGVAMLAVRDDTIGVLSGAENDYEPLHTNENGALWVEQDVSTKGGWSVGNFTSGDTYTALTATAQVLKASAGKFGGYYIYNPNAAATYVHIYNIAAASVTVGTSTAIMTFCIPASSAANLEMNKGIAFGTAMSIAATTTGGGNTAPTTALECLIWYK